MIVNDQIKLKKKEFEASGFSLPVVITFVEWMKCQVINVNWNMNTKKV